LKADDAIHNIAIIQGLRNVNKGTNLWDNIFPTWGPTCDYWPGVIAISVDQIESVVGMVVESNSSIMHLITPGIPIWRQNQLTMDEVRSLSCV
jgi:hypothetical protein